MKDIFTLLIALLVMIIAGYFLSRARGIELGWENARATPEYRRHVRNAARAATENGAVSSFDAKRNIMRIESNIWAEQGDRMRMSLLRLASRYFELEGSKRFVEVRSTYGDQILATFDGGNKYVFKDRGEKNQPNILPDAADTLVEISGEK